MQTHVQLRLQLVLLILEEGHGHGAVARARRGLAVLPPTPATAPPMLLLWPPMAHGRAMEVGGKAGHLYQRCRRKSEERPVMVTYVGF